MTYSRFDHMASKAFTIPTQSEGKELPVKTLALLQMPDGPKILSGSVDSVVKVTNKPAYFMWICMIFIFINIF